MSRLAVTRCLILYLLVVWGAVVFRIDHFPLTWAPMYSVYEPKNGYRIRLESKKQIKRGFRVTHRDGSTSWVGRQELNIPTRNMRRLYYQRAFGKPPPKHEQGNANLGALNRRVRGLRDDEANYPPVEWDWRLFWSLNKTLGYEPSDPRFIVRIEASAKYTYFSKPALQQLKRKRKRVTLEWKEEWRERWR